MITQRPAWLSSSLPLPPSHRSCRTAGGVRPPIPGPSRWTRAQTPTRGSSRIRETQPQPRTRGNGKGKAGKGKDKARAGGWSPSWDTQSTDIDNTVCPSKTVPAARGRVDRAAGGKEVSAPYATSQYGILKPLVQSSMEWNNMRDSGKVTCNLRICLFHLMMQELIARLKKLQESPQSIFEATKALWVTKSTEMVVSPLEPGLDQWR